MDPDHGNLRRRGACLSRHYADRCAAPFPRRADRGRGVRARGAEAGADQAWRRSARSDGPLQLQVRGSRRLQGAECRCLFCTECRDKVRQGFCRAGVADRRWCAAGMWRARGLRQLPHRVVRP